MVPRRWFSTRGPLSRNANKENYKKKKSDYKRNSSHEFIYARLIDQLSPLHHHAATSLTHRKYGGWEPPMCREPKSGALYSTDFPRTRFPRNARVGAKKNFILNTFSPFSPPFRVRIRESTVSLSLSVLLVVSRIATHNSSTISYFSTSWTANWSTMEIPSFLSSLKPCVFLTFSVQPDVSALYRLFEPVFFDVKTADD